MNIRTVAATLLFSCIFVLTAHTPIQPVNCEFTGQGVTLCRETKVLTGKTPFCKEKNRYDNFKDRLRITIDPNTGTVQVQGPVRPNPLPKRWRIQDTAWFVRTARLPIQADDNVFSLRFILSTNVVVARIRPFVPWKTGIPLYRNILRWYGKDGKVLEEKDLPLLTRPEGPVENRLTGKIPAGAIAASVEFGYNAPKMDEEDFFRISGFSFASGRETAPFMQEGSFLTCRMPREELGDQSMLKLTGNFPAGSTAEIQVQGQAGKFCGPDGTGKSFYRDGDTLSRSHRKSQYLRFKICLKGNGKVTPRIDTLTAGEKQFAFTSGMDAKPPVIRRLSPSPAQDPATPLVFSVTDENDVAMESFHAVLDGKDVTAKLIRNGNVFTYTPEKPFSMEVPHHITVSAEDRLGYRRVKKLFFIFYREFLKKGIVTLRKDGCILIDGKPFFPIGVVSVCPLPINHFSFDKAFGDLKALGQNVMPTSHFRRVAPKMPMEEMLKLVRKHGFYYYSAASGAGDNANDLENIVENVSKQFRSPGLIGWYTGNDASAHNTPEQMEDKNEAIKSVDPWHFTCQADQVGQRGVLSGYRDYIFGNDVFRLELYPIHKINPTEEREGVPAIVDDILRIREDIRLAGNPPRSVWALIQYFRGWSSWKRFPTPEEERCMNWLSIIHGANAIQWYTYNSYRNNHGVTHPEVWPHFQKQIREIASLQEILVEEKPAQPAAPEYLSGETKDTYSRPSMNFLLKHHQGKSYLFTANSAAKEVQCRFSLPGYRKAKLLAEEKAVFSLADGKLTAKYAPYGVHIFELTK